MNDLYFDGFSRIGFIGGYCVDENGREFFLEKPEYIYTNICGDFAIISKSVARFLVSRLNQNQKKGYCFIDKILRA